MTKANDSASTPSSEQQSVGNGAFRAQIRSFLLSNLTAVVGTFWSVCLFVGGLFFLIYFASIGFMPEFDLQTSIALLVVSALTGGFLLTILVFFLLAPGLWWMYMTRDQELLQSPGWFILPMLGIILSFVLTVWIPSTWWFLLAIVIIVVIAALAILFGEEFLKSLWFNIKQLLKNPWFNIKQLLNSLFISIKHFYKKSKQIDRQRWVAVFSFFFAFLVSSVFMLLCFLTVIRLMGQNKPLNENEISVAAISMSLAFLSNTIIVSKRSYPFLLVSFLVLVFIILLFIRLGTFPFISKRVISIYKFGNIQNASLVLTEMGCAITKNHGLKVTPYTPDPKIATTPDTKTCSLSNVIIHSRLGNTYYLEISRSSGAAMHFTIPGQNVLSWAVDESKKATTAGAPASTQNPAPTTEIAPPNKGMEPTR